MPESIELLPADKRDAIQAELANTVPASTVTLLKGWRARTIGPRTMRWLLGASVEIERLRAELERRWEYGFRVIDRPGASVHPDGISPVEWIGSEAEAREFAPRWMREWRYASRTSRAEIVRRYAAGEVEVVTTDENEANNA